ncbi:MAG: hypothetical protein H5U40_19385, partial [Polyangiaceae bacterium]|nr:hypothetical protein [Polyangiaceae bacterium]
VGGGFYRFAGLLPEEGGHLYSVLTGGFSARLGSTASIHAEGVLPGIYRDGSGAAGFGSFGLALWGFRFNAPHCAVDASLVYPLHEDLWRVYEIWPLGLPWLTVAFPF